jgi:type IV pilus assembly protein PilE
MRASPAPGFTLTELLFVLAIAGILATLTMPNFQAALLKARRSDVLVAAAQIQGAQERMRSQAARYGSLSEIGSPVATPAGYYALQMRSFDATGYELLATATGQQARDTDCRYMAVRSTGLNLVYASGTDAAVANADAPNRRCWSL